MDPDDLRTVRLIGLPLGLQAESREHMADLLRELQLISMSTQSLNAMPAHHREVPARLLSRIEDISARYAHFTQAGDLARDQALAQGEDSVDLTLNLPLGAAAAARALLEGLDELDQFCRDGGYLLTLETGPVLVALRRWYLTELAEQLESGRPPQPWNVFAARQGVGPASAP